MTRGSRATYGQSFGKALITFRGKHANNEILGFGGRPGEWAGDQLPFTRIELTERDSFGTTYFGLDRVSEVVLIVHRVRFERAKCGGQIDQNEPCLRTTAVGTDGSFNMRKEGVRHEGVLDLNGPAVHERLVTQHRLATRARSPFHLEWNLGQCCCITCANHAIAQERGTPRRDTDFSSVGIFVERTKPGQGHAQRRRTHAGEEILRRAIFDRRRFSTFCA